MSADQIPAQRERQSDAPKSLETVDEAVSEFFRFIFAAPSEDDRDPRHRAAYFKLDFDERVRRIGAAYLRTLSDRGPLDAALGRREDA